MIELGTQAPDFELADPDGRNYNRDEVAGKHGLLVIFMCNHCPFVKLVASELGRVGKEYQELGIGIVGINSNDIQNYPEDAPPKMAEFAANYGITFPYLFDESQEVAKSYKAACTPDFFLFDAGLKLVYRGQMDDSRPKNDQPVNGKDLRAAMDALIQGEPIPEEQKPSIGCNIKWKTGNAPDF